jgi:hypothetical protein
MILLAEVRRLTGLDARGRLAYVAAPGSIGGGLVEENVYAGYVPVGGKRPGPSAFHDGHTQGNVVDIDLDRFLDRFRDDHIRCQTASCTELHDSLQAPLSIVGPEGAWEFAAEALEKELLRRFARWPAYCDADRGTADVC